MMVSISRELLVRLEDAVLRTKGGQSGETVDAILAVLAGSNLTSEQLGAWRVGTPVLKHTGDYQLAGEVRASFLTKAGKLRYAVEHEPGFLHIYGPQNIKVLL